jgi:hypothetical protein
MVAFRSAELPSGVTRAGWLRMQSSVAALVTPTAGTQRRICAAYAQIADHIEDDIKDKLCHNLLKAQYQPKRAAGMSA